MQHSWMEYVLSDLIDAIGSHPPYLTGRRTTVRAPMVGLKQIRVMSLPDLWLLPYHGAMRVSDQYSFRSASHLRHRLILHRRYSSRGLLGELSQRHHSAWLPENGILQKSRSQWTSWYCGQESGYWEPCEALGWIRPDLGDQYTAVDVTRHLLLEYCIWVLSTQTSQ